MLGFWWLRRSLSLCRMIQSLRVRAVSVEYFHLYLATYIHFYIDLNYCAEFITEISFFLRHSEKTLGKIIHGQVMQHSVLPPPTSLNPPLPCVWTNSPSVLHQYDCGCVNMCFCVWMSSISVLREGCVCLTNRNNSIPKSMDSTSSLFQGSRYTCCPLCSWPLSFPFCLSSFFRLAPHHLKPSVAFQWIKSSHGSEGFCNSAAGVLPLYAEI